MTDPDYSDTDWAVIGYVAGRANLDPSTLYRWAKEGRVPTIKRMRASGIGRRPTLHFRLPDVMAAKKARG